MPRPSTGSATSRCLLTIILLAVVIKGKTEPTTLTQFIEILGRKIAYSIDFPYSPVRLVSMMMSDTATSAETELLRTLAGISYIVSLITLAVFVLLMRVLGWPSRDGAFNVWVNLPTFDPATGGDVVKRMRRDAGLNITLGFMLPFLIPPFVHAASFVFEPMTAASSQTLIWTMTAWAFLPASLFMRGIAIMRVARHDLSQAAAKHPGRGRGVSAGLIVGLALALTLAGGPALAETLRIASYNVGLSRRGPGLLARDILTGKDKQAEAVAAVIAAAGPDVIVLQGVDYDHGLVALRALADRLVAAGAPYPHLFAWRPNTGMGTDLDMDGDGRLRGPRDAQGFGWFAGEGGMAVLSKLPLDDAAAQDFSAHAVARSAGQSAGRGRPVGRGRRRCSACPPPATGRCR